MAERSSADVVMGIYEAMGRDDLPAILERVASAVEWRFQGPETLPFAGTRHGREAVGDFFAAVGQSLEFEVFEPKTVVSNGDTVVVLGQERSRARATGAVVEQEWAHVFTVQDGMITQFRGFEDTAALAVAMRGDADARAKVRTSQV